MDFQQKECYTIGDLEHIIALLRAPGGCPWDIEQTHQSVRANLIEETYEAVEAIDTNNMELLKGRIGRCFNASAVSCTDGGRTGNVYVCRCGGRRSKKLIVRHPHVFGNVQVTDSSQVLSNWDEIKKKTKSQTTQTEVLESVSVALPALMRSYKVQKKAAKVGVDVSDANAALDQIIARAQELKQTLSKQQDSNLLEHQVGDLLFSAVNVARKCEVEPEYSLTNACNRFIIYFTAVEKYTQEKQLCWSDLTPQELNSIWQRVTTEQFSQ